MHDLKRRFPVYSRLLYLYPPAYRREYGAQMLQTLADMLDESDGRRLRIWSRTVIDYPFSVAYQQLTFVGGTMDDQMPGYIKRNSLLGIWLVTPFFLFLTLSALNARSYLHRSVFWHHNVLFTWLVLLPSLAIVFNLLAWMRWLVHRGDNRRTVTQKLADLRHSWPALTVIILGLGILAFVYGHDSVHCLAGNPLHLLRNWRQTWSCVQAG